MGHQGAIGLMGSDWRSDGGLIDAPWAMASDGRICFVFAASKFDARSDSQPFWMLWKSMRKVSPVHLMCASCKFSLMWFGDVFK